MERAINYFSSSFFCHQGRKERHNSTESLDVGYGKCPEFVCVDGLIVSKEQADWREEDTEQSMISTQGTLTTLRYSTLTTLRYSTLTTLMYRAPSPHSSTWHPHHPQVQGTQTSLRYRGPSPSSGTVPTFFSAWSKDEVKIDPGEIREVINFRKLSLKPFSKRRLLQVLSWPFVYTVAIMSEEKTVYYDFVILPTYMYKIL